VTGKSITYALFPSASAARRADPVQDQEVFVERDDARRQRVGRAAAVRVDQAPDDSHVGRSARVSGDRPHGIYGVESIELADQLRRSGAPIEPDVLVAEDRERRVGVRAEPADGRKRVAREARRSTVVETLEAGDVGAEAGVAKRLLHGIVLGVVTHEGPDLEEGPAARAAGRRGCRARRSSAPRADAECRASNEIAHVLAVGQ